MNFDQRALFYKVLLELFEEVLHVLAAFLGSRADEIVERVDHDGLEDGHLEELAELVDVPDVLNFNSGPGLGHGCVVNVDLVIVFLS